MIELLALPGWQTPPTTLDAWVAQLEARRRPDVDRRPASRPGVAWLEIAALRLRGYAMIEGRHVEAINFELARPRPRARRPAPSKPPPTAPRLGGPSRRRR